MGNWNFADIWEAVADTVPDATACVQGDRRESWRDFDRRADGVAAFLLAQGVQHQDKVAQYLYNCPEYLETLFGCFKAALVPVNTNYRYTDDELVYLWDNSDSVCVVFHGSFVPTIERIRTRLTKVRTWLWVDDGSGPCPAWAVPYETAATTPTDRVIPAWGRTGQDLYFIYTGGTTGMPKGVMWEQDTLVDILLMQNPLAAAPKDLAELKAKLAETGPGFAGLPACPLMHGTGALTTFALLSGGGKIALAAQRHLDTAELLRLIGDEKINMLIIVGDTFAKPLLAELDANEAAYDISSLVAIVSSGVMWSEGTKKGLLAHNPNMLLMDSLGSSEAVGMGSSLSAGDNASKTAKFAMGGNAVVVRDDGTLVEAGSGEIGRIGVRGLVPVGYYKDPEKSAATFPVIDGVRYSLPGDFATVEADGSITLLGRGSVCINTGGEKVFPEEVEEVLKTHPSVADAVAVGVPDDRFGERIVAVVEARSGEAVVEQELIDHVKSRIAAYKAPRQVVTIDTIGRGPNAKVDYKRMKAYAADKAG